MTGVYAQLRLNGEPRSPKSAVGWYKLLFSRARSGGRPMRIPRVSWCRLDTGRSVPYPPALIFDEQSVAKASVMKVRNSLKSAKVRDKNCRVVRRHGRVYVINKKNPRMKARQG